MPSRRDKFPGLPEEQLPLDVAEAPVSEQRFDPDQYRAFGSVPTMLGKLVDVPPFERLDSLAWQRTEPAVLARGLFGVEGNTAVNGLALGADHYKAIVRNHDAFQASIRNTTLAANRQTGEARAREKDLRSVLGALRSKQERHEKILSGLETQREVLTTLSDMQRTPGYHRHLTETDVRLLATTAWDQSFLGMLRVLKDQHDLTNNDFVEMSQAMSYRLLRGSQKDRIHNWGDMLALGTRYNRAVGTMFTHSLHEVTRGHESLEGQLEAFYEQNGLTSPASYVVGKTTELES